MRKFDFWKTDWFLGVMVVIVVALFNRFSDLVPSLERKAYDLGVNATTRAPSDKVAVIAIDEASIRSIGRWPWPRDVQAKMTDLLSQAKVKVIGSTILLSEPQVDPGYQYVVQLQELAAKRTEAGESVAEALGYAHTQGVVHRDVKPANIMYHLETDTLKVTDFGIARLTDSSKTKTGMVLGTPSFMSPEQLAGKKIEGRSDLFSLAVSLYQLLSGKLPFEGESMAQLMFKIAGEPSTDILTVNPSVPAGLVAFLERALAKNPDDRFQTGAEFAAALRAAVSEAPAVAAAAGVDIEL